MNAPTAALHSVQCKDSLTQYNDTLKSAVELLKDWGIPGPSWQGECFFVIAREASKEWKQHPAGSHGGIKTPPIRVHVDTGRGESQRQVPLVPNLIRWGLPEVYLTMKV